MRGRALGLTIALAAGGACALPGRHREPLPSRQSPTRDSLLALDLSRNDSLARRGFASTMRVFFAPSVLYLRAGAYPAYGATRALHLLEAPNPRAAPFTAWQPIGGGISRDALTGYTFGIAIRTRPDVPGTLIERYIAVWEREPSSPWRMVGYVEVSPGSLSTSAGDKISPARDRTARAQELFESDSAFGVRASTFGAATAVSEYLSDDGVLLATTQLVVGPRAASEYFESRRAFSISWVPREAAVAASGDLGFTTGDALSTSRGPTGAAVQRFTKYLTVWRRDVGGDWRVVVTGANDRPSPISN